MKKVLIIGKNSFIGMNLEKWLNKNPNEYFVNSISIRNDLWEEFDFSKYNVVVHLAGIAHIKETKENAELYFKVNRDLAYKVAQKAKNDGVEQFIFLSSMSVYGIDTGIIKRDTPLNPKSNYGRSKCEAEELIARLKDNEAFKVAILRPPMIYGKNCKGNYPKLSNLAVKTPFFPDVGNKRSMIYIDCLSEFIKSLIDDCTSGIFFPQNSEYVKTSEMVRLIAASHGRKVRLVKLFNPILKMLKASLINKIFGDLVYDQSLSKYNRDYMVCSFEESIIKTEK